LRDYSTNRKKEVERSSRLDKIMARKKLPDIKEDMCDLKYFRRNPWKMILIK